MAASPTASDLDLGGQVTVATAPDAKRRSHTTSLPTVDLVGGPLPGRSALRQRTKRSNNHAISSVGNAGGGRAGGGEEQRVGRRG